jgi:hypothetical protein
MKESYYFRHDYDPTSDLKIGAMLTEFGATGYGLFWRIVEILHSEEEHKIPKKEYFFLTIAKQMGTEVEQVKAFVQKCSDVYDLFRHDENYFWSERVFRNFEVRNSIKEKRSEAGKKSAESRKNATIVEQNLTSAEQVSTSVEQNSTNANKEKKRKEKENKEKEIKEEESNINNTLFDFKKSCIDFGFNESLVNDWLIVRKGKKASNTETSFKIFVGQVKKSGLDKNFVLQECVYRNWISFKASWKIEQPQQQTTDSTQPIGTNKKPFTKLRRKDFKSNSEFLGACHKRQENPDPFDFSFPKDLTKDKTDEQIEYMEAELMRDNPNGLRIEL